MVSFQRVGHWCIKCRVLKVQGLGGPLLQGPRSILPFRLASITRWLVHPHGKATPAPLSCVYLPSPHTPKPEHLSSVSDEGKELVSFATTQATKTERLRLLWLPPGHWGHQDDLREPDPQPDAWPGRFPPWKVVLRAASKTRQEQAKPRGSSMVGGWMAAWAKLSGPL